MPTEPKCGPLTAAVISKQAEMLFGTTADMAIALRNHACRMEADRALLIEALRELHAIDERKLAASERRVYRIGHSVIEERVRRNRTLLRDLGALK